MQIRFAAIVTFLSLLPIYLAARAPESPTKTVYDYSIVGLDGKTIPLAMYKGKVLLIVNLASHSIYSRQLQALNDLQKHYSDKGFVVLGIPSNDFGAEELKDNSAIEQHYRDTEHVTFPIFSTASLRGQGTIPLIHFLTDPKIGTGGGDIHWNFTKFLVDRQGHPVIRWEAHDDPADPDFRVKVEEVLEGTYKKGETKDKSGSSAEQDDEDGDR